MSATLHNQRRLTLSLTILALFIPTLSYAVDFSLAGSTFQGVIYYILDVIYVLLPILYGLSFFIFFWGLSKFILNSSNKDGIKDGRTYMIWGVLALFILITFRAIIGLVRSDLELGNDTPLLPTGKADTSANRDYLPVFEPGAPSGH